MGSIHDIALYRSSGNNDLDKAALACESATGREPMMRDGKPIDGNGVGAVGWSEHWHQLIRPDRTTATRYPCHLHYPAAAILH